MVAVLEEDEKLLGVMEILRNMESTVKGKDVNDYLVIKGYLSNSKTDEGHLKRNVTQEGYKLGLTVVERTSADGRKYEKILFDENAQEYVKKNIFHM